MIDLHFMYLLAQSDLQGVVENVELKPGKCPPSEEEEKECPPVENMNTTCLLDKDCEGNMKCCQLPCAFGCVEPVDLPKPVRIVGPKGPPGEKGDQVSLTKSTLYWPLNMRD